MASTIVQHENMRLDYVKGEVFSPRVPSNKEYIDKEALLGEGGGGVERPCAPSEFHNQLCHNFGAFLYYLVEFSQVGTRTSYSEKF